MESVLHKRVNTLSGIIFPMENLMTTTTTIIEEKTTPGILHMMEDFCVLLVRFYSKKLIYS